MDWEKKTAHRDALKHATKDAFNNFTAPGQVLLGAVQGAEDVRKARYFDTVDAKMKAAREKLPSLEPKHAVKSDNTIFPAKPRAEVARLLPTVVPQKTDLVNVKNLLVDKMDRHSAGWETFKQERDTQHSTLGAAVASIASELQQDIAASDAELEAEMSALNEDQVGNAHLPALM